MFNTKNLSVYCVHEQNERQPNGDAFCASRIEHEAQAVRGHAQKRDVPLRPMIFAYFSSQEKYEPARLKGIKLNKVNMKHVCHTALLFMPFAGGTSFFPTAEKRKQKKPWLSKNTPMPREGRWCASPLAFQSKSKV